MRTDGREPNTNNLHFHDGSTCHGAPTLEECQEDAIANRWVGKILEREDVYPDDKRVKCYSLIAGSFDRHGERGKYVAEVKLVAVPIPEQAT